MLELIFSDYRPFIQDVLAFTICGAALVWGGGPERAVALTWLIVFEASGRVYDLINSSGYQLVDVDIFLALVDVIAGVVWLGVALYANRNYTLWIAGMQILAMSAHVAGMLSETMSPVAYLTMVAAPGWLQLIFFGIGLTRHIRRKREFGPYRDWRFSQTPDHFSPPSGRAGLATGAVGNLQTSWRDNLK